MPGMNRETGRVLSEREHILQSLRTLVLTPVGTRVKRRDYGSLIPYLIDQPLNSATLLRLYAATAAAIMRWEPRVTLVSMNLTVDSGQYVLDLVVVINDETAALSIEVV